jgi:hypothetical protein
MRGLKKCTSPSSSSDYPLRNERFLDSVFNNSLSKFIELMVGRPLRFLDAEEDILFASVGSVAPGKEFAGCCNAV